MGQEPVFSRVHPCCGRGKSARPTLGGQPERVREPLPAGRGRLVAEGKGFCSNFIPLVGWCERFGVWTTFQRQCSRWVRVSHALHTQVRECSRRREYRVSGAIRESAIRAPRLLKEYQVVRNDALPFNVFGCVIRYVFCTYLVFVLHTCMIRVFQAVRARIYHLGSEVQRLCDLSLNSAGELGR